MPLRYLWGNRDRDFAPGSMGPKVDAACRFAEATGRPAYVGRLDEVSAILAGSRGTAIVAVGSPTPTMG